MLSHPNLKAGLTHCGMGGTMEFITRGVPAVTWPHFGDQTFNSSNLVDNGAAISLYSKFRIQGKEYIKAISFVDPVFDA